MEKKSRPSYINNYFVFSAWFSDIMTVKLKPRLKSCAAFSLNNQALGPRTTKKESPRKCTLVYNLITPIFFYFQLGLQ